MNDREARRKELLDVAAKLFSEKGYTATTIKDIGSATGKNQAMVYYYFTDKQQLLFDSMSAGLNKLTNIAKKIYKKQLEPQNKLELLIKAHINQLSSDRPAQAIANSELRHLTPKNRRKFISSRDKYEQIFRDVILEAIEQRKMRRQDPKMVSIFILQLINATTRWYKSDGQYSLNKITSLLIDFINKGIKL